jgi:4-alpha-glucanotransferase
VFVRRGATLPAAARWIHLEHGGEVAAMARLPFDFPLGYHRLTLRNGSERLLVVSPGHCHRPPERAWGWAVQLYALRSRQSWGMGDLGDLRRLAAWSRRLGAGMLIVNPLHAARSQSPEEPSPYFVSSRLFRNPLYLNIDAVPGARDDSAVHEVAQKAQQLNTTARIDRDRIAAMKMGVLERLWERFTGHGEEHAFTAFRSEHGSTLQLYATFCALSEWQRKPWRAWPARFRSPHSPALHQFAGERPLRIDFHCWLQWLLEVQLAAAAREAPLVNDLAVGFAPDGFDAWLWQDAIAPGVDIGAPPDEFSMSGQDWGLAAFDPVRLRQAGYVPLIETLRSVMRYSAGIRVDHVMGMFRLWWVPTTRQHGRRARYVRYRASELLDVLALESTRARCYVVGEDLGTVERGVRAEMRRRGAMSYRVAWFESEPPQRYPELALAAMSTHDLPTVAGVWTGDDLRDQEACGRDINRAGEARTRARLRRVTGAADDTPLDEVVERAYSALATSPCALVAASLDDVTLARRRPNMPGAPHRDNWAIPLPRTLEQLRRDQLPRRVAKILNRPRPG